MTSLEMLAKIWLKYAAADLYAVSDSSDVMCVFKFKEKRNWQRNISMPESGFAQFIRGFLCKNGSN